MAGAQDEQEEFQRQFVAALETSRTISTAVGLLMAERRVSRSAAFDALRSQSQHTNVKVSAVAADLVSQFERRCP